MSFAEVKEYYAVYRSYFHTVAVLAVFAALAFALIESRARRLEREAHWPKASAEIVESAVKVHGHVGKKNPQHGITARLALSVRYQANDHEITAYLIESVSGPLSWEPEKIFTIGTAVTIRYNPYQLEEIRLYHPGRLR